MVQALRYANGMIYAGGLFAGPIGVNLAQITEAGTVVRFPGANSPVPSLARSGRTLTFGGDFTQVLKPVSLCRRGQVAIQKTINERAQCGLRMASIWVVQEQAWHGR